MPSTVVAPPPMAGGGGNVRPNSGIGNLLRDPDNYEEINVIGNGAYGTVYKARDTKNGAIVAIKKVKIGLTDDGVPMQVLREISLLKQLGKSNHPNIVRLLDICHGQRMDREMVLYLVFEHVDQDLHSFIENCPPPGIGKERIKDIIWQILSGVDFLHSHRIVHRDLKPQNILVSNNCQIKLADFGLARIYDFSSLLTSVVVTLWYRSPEVLLGNSYATPVDLWSCGCIFAELYLRRPLFPGRLEADQLNYIFSTLGTPSAGDWPANSNILPENFPARSGTPLENVVPEMEPQAMDLLKRLLIFNPDDRISAGEALSHIYFSDFGFSSLAGDGGLVASGAPTPSTSSGSEASGSEGNTSISPINNNSSSASETSSDGGAMMLLASSM